MLGDFDYYGASALVAAIGGVVASVLAFLAREKAKEVATHVENVAAAVATGNGYTLGEVADRTEARAAGEPLPEGSIKQIDPNPSP